MARGNHERAPALSVIVATPDSYQTVRQLVRYLARQTIVERLELVFVVPRAERLGLIEADLAPFLQRSVIETGPFRSLNHARVAGIRAAAAPVVALTEDHCFPTPTWAEALVAAHQDGWAAVGPTIGLANKHSLRAWASFLIQYAPWMMPTPGSVVDDIPGHNSSYKKEILFEYGDDLESMMDFEYVLHQDFQRKGYKIYLESSAEAYHLFMTKLVPSLREHYNIGRLLAATRARHTPRARRLLATASAPLVPGVRLLRILRQVHGLGWQRELLPGILPWLAIGLSASALGELVGYAIGKGQAQKSTLDLDFHRERFVSTEERARIWADELLDFGIAPTSPTLSRSQGS